MAKNLLQRFVQDTHGRPVLWQRPNVPLATWFVAEVVGLVVKHGWPHRASHDVGMAALLVWSLLEIFQGASYFRRTLGLVVLTALVLHVMR